MKQLIQNYKTGEVELEEVPIATVGLGSALVQSSYSLKKS